MIDVTWLVRRADAVPFLVYVPLLAALVLAERRWAARRPSPVVRGRVRANAMLTALNIVALGLLPVSLLGTALWAEARDVGLLRRMALPSAALLAANLLARGFVSFLTHLLMHKVPVFWRVHRVHHLDTEMDVSTTVRFHPLEFAVGLIPGVPLVALLGLTPWMLVVYDALDAAVTLFSHANLRLPPGVERRLRYLVVTPGLHRIHHSTWQPETDSNYSAVFPVWDLVFGTFRGAAREPQETMSLGLEEVRDRRTSSVGWLLASPFVSFDPPGEARERRAA